MKLKEVKKVLEQGGLILRVKGKSREDAEYATEAEIAGHNLVLTCPTRGLGVSDNLGEQICYGVTVSVEEIADLHWVTIGEAAYLLRQAQPTTGFFYGSASF